MYQIKLNGRFLFHSPNLSLLNEVRSRYYPNSDITFNRQILESISDGLNLTHTLTFRRISTVAVVTTTKQSYAPITEYFNFYHLRAIQIDPPLATVFSEIPNIHLLEVYNVTKDVYLLDFTQTGLFWNNSLADNANSPSTRNKLGSAFNASTGTNQLWAQFYYGTRIRSNNEVVSSPGDIIRVRVREYISGSYGVDVVYGDTIAEIYFLEDAATSYSEPNYPTIVNSEGEEI